MRSALAASEKKLEEGQTAQARKSAEEQGRRAGGAGGAGCLERLFLRFPGGAHGLAKLFECLGEEGGGRPGSTGGCKCQSHRGSACSASCKLAASMGFGRP